MTSALQIFVVAVFERSTFKYADRGYRFAFLEAGHFAQNISLTAAAMQLGTVSIGGYYDRRIDEFLGMNGTDQSVVLALAVGSDKAGESGTEW